MIFVTLHISKFVILFDVSSNDLQCDESLRTDGLMFYVTVHVMRGIHRLLPEETMGNFSRETEASTEITF
jgi:hypothetical protein